MGRKQFHFDRNVDMYIDKVATKIAMDKLRDSQITMIATIFLKLYDEFGFGEQRLLRLMRAINKTTDGYINEAEGGDAITMDEVCKQLKLDTGFDILDYFDLSAKTEVVHMKREEDKL